MQNLLGVVIPTMGTRLDSLKKTILSIDQGEPVQVVIVAPKEVEIAIRNLDLPLPYIFVDDLDSGGAAKAISKGLDLLQGSCNYISWIGDDDMFAPNAISAVVQEMRKTNKELYFGYCMFIDNQGRFQKIYKPSRIFRLLLRYWWNPIPQPGSWFRSDAYKRVGGLNTNLLFAFDQDLWHRFQPKEIVYVRKTLGIYTFGPGTLSHDFAIKANLEASKVRLSYLRGFKKPLLASIYKLSAAITEMTHSNHRTGR
jgi:hypothetical protein